MQDSFVKWPSSRQKHVDICFSRFDFPSNIESSIEPNCATHPKFGIGPSRVQNQSTFPIIPSEECTNEIVIEDASRSGEFIDLNKTPPQKPKRKKIRPKVVREGTSARNPKSATPKPSTPEILKDNKVGSTGKRKYVRKKDVNSQVGSAEKPSGKRKYVRKSVNLQTDVVVEECSSGKINHVRGMDANPLVDSPMVGSGGPCGRNQTDINLSVFELDDPCSSTHSSTLKASNFSSNSHRLPVRRNLQFEGDDQLAGEPSESSLAWKGNINNLRETTCLDTSLSSGLSSAELHTNAPDMLTDSDPNGAIFDLNTAVDQMPNGCINLPGIINQFSQHRGRDLQSDYRTEFHSWSPNNIMISPPSNNSVSQMQSAKASEYRLPVSQQPPRYADREFKMLDGSVMPVNCGHNLKPFDTSGRTSYINTFDLSNGFVHPGIDLSGTAVSNMGHNERQSRSHTPTEAIEGCSFVQDAHHSVESYNHARYRSSNTMSNHYALPNSCKRVRTEPENSQSSLLELLSSPSIPALSTVWNPLQVSSRSSQTFTLADEQKASRNSQAFSLAHAQRASRNFQAFTLADSQRASRNPPAFTFADAQRVVALRTEKLQARNNILAGELMKENRIVRSDVSVKPHHTSALNCLPHISYGATPYQLLGSSCPEKNNFNTASMNLPYGNGLPSHSRRGNSEKTSDPLCQMYCASSLSQTKKYAHFAAPDNQLEFISSEHPRAPVPLMSTHSVYFDSLKLANRYYAKRFASPLCPSDTSYDSSSKTVNDTTNENLFRHIASEHSNFSSATPEPCKWRHIPTDVVQHQVLRKDKRKNDLANVNGQALKDMTDADFTPVSLNHVDPLKEKDIVGITRGSSKTSHPATIPNAGKSGNRKVARTTASKVTEQFGDQIDMIVRKLSYLDINRVQVPSDHETHHAIVPYDNGYGTMVLFKGTEEPSKKRKSRARVDIDPVTNMMWNLLMGKDTDDMAEGMDADKEKWLEEERAIFRGRIDSFIARMHLVQGDRRFSRWKGSVVDSVVGVFLTQNVSDHLSSSAFMSLAARFPVKAGCADEKPRSATVYSCAPETFDVSSKGSSKWEVEFAESSDFGLLVSAEEKEGSNRNESFGSTSGEGAGCSAILYSNIFGEKFDKSIHSNSHYNAAECAIVIEAEERSTEDIVSSQNSAVSSQNSPDYLYQATDHVRSSSLVTYGADEPLFRNLCNTAEISGSYTELIRRTELQSQSIGRISSAYPGVSVLPSPDVEKRISLLDAVYDDNYAHSALETSLSDYLNDLHEHSVAQCALQSNKQADSKGAKQNDLALVGYESDNLHSSPFDMLSGKAVMAVKPGSINRDDIDFTSHKSFCYPQPTQEVHPISAINKQYIQSLNRLEAACSSGTFIGHTALLKNLCGDASGKLLSLTGVQDDCKSTGAHAAVDETGCSSTSGANLEDQPSNKRSPQNCVDNHKQSSTSEVLLGVAPNEFVRSTDSLASTSSDLNIHLHTRDEYTTSEELLGSKRAEVLTNLQPSTIQVRPKDGSCVSGSNTDYKDTSTSEVLKGQASISSDKPSSAKAGTSEVVNDEPKIKKSKGARAKKATFEWDNLRKEVCGDGVKKERSYDTRDSLDYEALRRATVHELSQTIRERGMNNMLAERIKEFLDRLVSDHGSIDLEWLREVDPDKAKDYLLSIRGLGLKSVECVRLLTLHHLAFPVDTNVGRICVRLGWVPLQPLPESLQLHLLELYPILENIQKYIWPRLCKLDQHTLYELHYQMITFGKVFCTKSKPNCNSCPMRAECKHFASAFASARLALPGLEERTLVSSAPSAIKRAHELFTNERCSGQLVWNEVPRESGSSQQCQPVIEEPATPEPEQESEEIAIEDAFLDDPDEIPTIKLNFEEFTQNLKNYMQANNIEMEDADMSKALVAITPEAASLPVPKLKNINRLRTEHQVYELPDSHPLLDGFERREPDDPCPYLLSIWTPGETAQSIEEPKSSCDLQGTGRLCDRMTCFSCNSIREAQAQKVRATLLIPCRTAMRGSFPLNGTYFQVNEVFADHDTSQIPIDVPRSWIWNLPRRTVYFGTSIPTIFKGLTTEEIQHCFWRGFVCVRGFDRKSRAPRPLYARLHFPASKAKAQKSAAQEAAKVQQ